MRKLEHALADLRGALRRARARLPSADPARVEPARLVIRLDDADFPNLILDGDALGLPDWRRVLASAVTWLGPVPVTVQAGHRAQHPYLAEIVRFAHRLECRTLLVTDGGGLGSAGAEELVDCGLAAARIWVGGVSEHVHEAVVGSPLADATGALAALSAARKSRGARLDLEVGIPWQGPVASEVKAIIGWARQAGLDGFRLVAPWRATRVPTDPELLDDLSDEPLPFNRTPAPTFDELHAMAASQDGEPGFARSGSSRRNACPVGGQRVEITATGGLFCCPFKEPIGDVDDDLRSAWAAAGPHLQAISACDRACAHVELAPARLGPPWSG